MSERFVITVNRQFASHGREIAKRLSEILGVPCYDGELIQEAAEELSIPEHVVEQEEETAVRQPQLATRIPFAMARNSSSTQDDIFEVQAEFMKRVVKKGSCVVVGRCSDYILSDEPNALHIYIFAEYKARLQYCIDVLERSEEGARRTLREVDAMRDSYSMQYSGYLAEDKEYKDILIDSNTMGVEKTAQYLAIAARMKFGLDENFKPVQKNESGEEK